MKSSVLHAIPLFVAALAIDEVANAQKAPPAPSHVTPTPVPVAPTPVAPPTTSFNNVAGMTAGGPFSALEAKCKESGVKCTRGIRTFKGQPFDRVRLELPPSSSTSFGRAYVTAKGGTVIAVKGVYRTDDKARVQTIEKELGGTKPTLSRGASVWASAQTGLVVELGRTGRTVRFIDTKAATARGAPMTPQSFIRKADVAPALAFEPTGKNGPLKAEELSLAPVASPNVTATLRVPVKITLLRLYCIDENDQTSIVYGDDPFFHILGTHTNFNFPKPWTTQITFPSDVEAGGSMPLLLSIFDDNTDRRFLTFGEALGVQISLFEEDDASANDEIDFIYPIVEYAYAIKNQSKTFEYRQALQGDGAKYELTYKVEIGAAQPDPRRGVPSPPKFRSVDAKLFAGTFGGNIGSETGEITLSHLASYDPAYPNGVVYGQLKDGSQTANIRTQRLQGDSVELIVKYPSNNSTALLVGYLIGTGNALKIVGTLVRDGVPTRGVVLSKR